MKILMMNYELPPLGGGGGTTTKFLAKYLARSGVQVRILTTGFQGLPSHEVVDGYEVIRFKTRRNKVYQSDKWEMLLFMINGLPNAYRMVQSWRPDLFHIFFGYPTGPIGWMIRKRFNLPYVLSLLGADVPGIADQEVGLQHILLKPVTRIIWRNAGFVVANSQGLKEVAEANIPDCAVEVVDNGIDLETFYPCDRQKRSPDLRLLFVARFAINKRLDLLLQAGKELLDEGESNWSLMIIGDGPLRPTYEAFLEKDQHLRQRIHLLGWVKMDQLRDHYHSSDVFVLTSDYEGMSSVVLQAMACGMPIISTRVQGSDGMIIDGVNGFFIPYRDVPALKAAIKQFIHHPELLDPFGKQSVRLVERYDWKYAADRYLAYYQRTLQAFAKARR
jgi:glycosyltransferase involved in cell wall biosynthesis